MTDDPIHNMPSNRSFGLWFAAIFAAVAAGLYVKGAPYASAALLVLGCSSGALALYLPAALASFNKFWFLFGQILGKIVSPIVLGIIFFGILTPVGLMCRLMGRDVLRLKRSKAATYWIDRTMPSPDAASFKNQF